MNQSELWDEFYRSNPRPWRGNNKVPCPTPGRALDIGCGNGKTTSTLIDLGCDVTGIDFSHLAIESCRSRFPGSTFLVADATNLPFEDGSFDFVAAVHVVENLDDDQLALMVSEVHRTLRSGGHVFVRTFTASDMRSEKRSTGDIVYRYREPEDVVSFFHGFEVVNAERIDEQTKFGTTRSRTECLFKRS